MTSNSIFLSFSSNLLHASKTLSILRIAIWSANFSLKGRSLLAI